MLRNFLFVGLGGAFGCMARYGLSFIISRFWHQSFPFATFIINILGCFFIGVLFGLGERQEWLQSAAWLVLASGFCGGFTTFSTFALENVGLFQNRLLAQSVLYSVLSVVLGLVFCRLGIWLGK